MSVIYGATGNLTVEQTDDLRPTVLLTVSGLGIELVRVRITRNVNGVSLTVPGALELEAVDSAVVRDYAPPLNTTTTYTLYVNDVLVDVKVIQVVSDTAWIQDPRQPDRALPVLVDRQTPGFLSLRDEALKEVKYPTSSSRMQVMGDPLPVSFGGQRGAASGVNVSVSSYDKSTADAFRELISEAPILLLRTVEQMVPLPSMVYLLAEVVEQPRNVHIGGGVTAWSVTGDFVRPVLQQVISGFLTYDDVQAVLGSYTYDEVQALAGGTTYLDWQKNPLIFTTL